MLIDTHAHLFWGSFQEGFEEMLKRVIDASISTIINVGVDVETSKKALNQIDTVKWPNGLIVYSSIGIHPEEAIKYANSTNIDVSIHEDISRLEELYLSSPTKIKAVGECGLDFLPNWIPSLDAKNLQIKLFQAQIDLASKLKLPLLVHCRDDRSKDPENSEAWDMVIKMIGQQAAILHCYSGLLPTTNYVLQTTNLVFSFAGNITYPKNEYLREAIKLIPLDRIVLETDCPFLPPQSIRGKRNEPALVLEVAQTIAQIKKISLEEVATKTCQNVAKLLEFKLN